MRGVTVNPVSPANIEAFQLTRLMRGVTRHLNFRNLFLTISTHTPHARRDKTEFFFAFAHSEFQLTCLMRGVTKQVVLLLAYIIISTHTPHARRDSLTYCISHTAVISTHTPHARRD